MSSAPLLQIENLCVAFDGGGTNLAVDNVSFSLARNQVFGIVGESGAGKSALLRAVVGLVRVSSGCVKFSGEIVTNARGHRIRTFRREVQLVFQNPYTSLPPGRQVKDILNEPLDIHAIDVSTRAASIDDALDGVGLSRAFLRRTPEQLSGGQRQRVAIARALVLRPKVLLLDEPVSALDVSIRAQVLNLLADLRAQFGLSFVIVSHDLSVLRFLADEMSVMYRGQFVERGTVASVTSAPIHHYTTRLLASIPSIEKSIALTRTAA